MANYSTLKTAIADVVKTNGNNEITGALLQQTLFAIVESIGLGYQFIGPATPQTVPGTPDQRVFYLGASGTYPNFGPAIIPSGSLGIFYYDTSWHVSTVPFPIGDGSITESKIESTFLSKLLAGYVYKGVAVPASNPGTQNRDCFFVTTTAGTYTNYGGIVVNAGEIAILKCTDSTWTKDVLSVPIADGSITKAKMEPTFVAELLAGYVYGGKATENGNPGTITRDTFFMTSEPGTYTNYGNVVVGDAEIAIIKYSVSGGTWAKESIGIPELVEIVNNLEDGGTDKALSAEMGKTLSQMIDETAFNAENVTRKVDIVGCSIGSRSFYINAINNVWKTSTSTTCFFVPIIPGRTYEITASNQSARIAILNTNTSTTDTTPDYADGETSMRYIAANKKYRFTAPNNAHWLYSNLKLSGTVITPSAMVEYIPQEDFQNELINGQKLQQYAKFGGAGYGIDATATSGTFGNTLRISSDNNWGFTNYFYVKGAAKVRFNTNLATTANSVALSGAVFYDENYTPISDGNFTLFKESASRSGWVTLSVPTNAVWFRFTLYYNAGLEGSSNQIFTWASDYDAPLHPGTKYSGERIVLTPLNGYTMMRYANNGPSGCQSAAIYGKYLFCVTEFVSKISLYNIETKSLVYTLTTGITQESTCHANQSSFGLLKYNSEDMFPVLYISHARNSGGRGIIDAYRIVPTLNNDEITSFTVERVQRILLPVMTTANGLGYPNAAIDPDNGAMWIYSRNTNDGETTSGLATFTRFNTPALSNADVTLEDSDIKDFFMEKWAIYNNQGAFIYKGKLYMSRGTGSASSHNELNVIDLYYKRCRVSNLDIYPQRAFEPEGCFYYQDRVFILTSSGEIVYLDL